MNNMAVVAFRFFPLPFTPLCVHVSCLCTSNIMALKFLLPSGRINLFGTRSEKTTLNFQDLYIKTMKHAPIKRNMWVPMREYPSRSFSKTIHMSCAQFNPQIKGKWWYKFRVLIQVYPFHLIQCNFIPPIKLTS